MQLEQHFIVAVPLARVWEAFHDPELLVSCLPGASLRGPAEGGTLPLMFKVKLGPIAAAFAGTGELTLDASTHRGALSGQAADGKSNSRVKGDAAFDLTEADGATRVGVNVTFSITGSLAQFSREGIVRALADQLTRQFAENLQGVLADEALGQHDMPDASSETSHALPAAPAEATAPLPTVAAGDAAVIRANDMAAADTASSGPTHAPAVALPPAAATAPPRAVPRQPSPRPAAQAPALNLFSLIGAVIRDYWRKLFKRRPS